MRLTQAILHFIVGNTISDDNVIISIGNTSNLERVAIKNGSIVSSGFRYAIQIDSNNSKEITLQDLIIESVTFGFFVPSGVTINNFLSKNVRIYQIGSGTGFSLNNVKQALIQDCLVADSVGDSSGFFIQGTSQYITFKNCQVSNLGLGGFIVSSTGTDYVFDNCQAFRIRDLGAFAVVDSSAQRIIFNSCSCTDCTTGFNLMGLASLDNAFVLNNCIAQKSSNIGFSFDLSNGSCNQCIAENSTSDGFSITGNNWQVKECCANKNQGTGFNINGINTILKNNISSFNVSNGFAGNNSVGLLISQCTANSNTNHGFDLSTTGTATVESCVAQNNGFGLSGVYGFNGSPDNNVIFYLNSASANGTSGANNYQNVNHPPSAAIASISGTPVYGNNLSA